MMSFCRVVPLALIFLAFASHAVFAEQNAEVQLIESLKLNDAKRNQEVEVLVRYPKGEGPFPLIVFSHGFGAGKTAYGPISEFWASHGFVVVHPQHADGRNMQNLGANGARGAKRPAGGFGSSTEERREELRKRFRERRQGGAAKDGNSRFKGGKGGLGKMLGSPESTANRVADVIAVLDGIEQLEKGIPDLAGKIDRQRLAVSGHSFGAATAMLVAGVTTDSGTGEQKSFRDPRVGCLLAFSAAGTGEYGLTQESWQDLKLPSLFVTGTRDIRPGYEFAWRREAFELSPEGEKYLLVLEGATHFHFGGGPAGWNRSGAGRFGGGRPGGIAEYTKIVKSASLAFWQAHLVAPSAQQPLQLEVIRELSDKVASFETK